MVEANSGPGFCSARWSCIARPGTVVLVAAAPSDLLEVNGGRASRAGRIALGDKVSAVIETRREEQPTQQGRPHMVGLLRLGSYGRPDPQTLEKSPIKAQQVASRIGAARLLAEQKDAWAARWEEADVDVVGDPELTQAVRLGLFHLMGSVTDHGEAAVGARGLSGPAYRGHVFWDADVFVLPFLAATRPAAARAMLEYRIRRLAAARENATRIALDGARFPWESASLGDDVTPTEAIDADNTLVAIHTGQLEEHITADVAWAAWQLASWTGRWEFLEGPGRPLLIDTARYWASRIRIDSDGVGHIDGVIGPDEYHEDVDDNAFTNQMAAWNLTRAAELVRRADPAPERAESEHWLALADALFDGFDPVSRRHVQFSGYDNLEPLLAAELGPVPVAADRLLGHERVAHSQVIKQADVLMAHHMIPGALERDSFEHDLNHYLPRTAHGSSLSPAIHAGLLARAGRLDEAVVLLKAAQRIDLSDATGSTGEGLHLAAMAGLWQALVLGFAGVRVSGPDDDTLVIDPHIPTVWQELRIKLQWHGAKVTLRCRTDAVHVACMSTLCIRLGSGAPVSVSAPGGWVARHRGGAQS